MTGHPPKTLPPPSEVLANDRHERFVHNLLKGHSTSESYKMVGFQPSATNARKVLAKPEVKARLDYLKELRAQSVVYDAAWIKDRFAKHAINLTEVIVEVDGTKKPGPMFSAAAGVTALLHLGREEGLFKERIELGGKVGIANTELLGKLTPAERSEMRSLLVAASARMPKPANENTEAPAETGVVGDRA